MTEYLLWMGGSSLAMCLWYGWALSREQGRKLTAGAGLLNWPLVLLCGAIGAKAGYMLLRADLMSAEWIGSMVRNWEPDSLSFLGGAAGVCAGVVLGAKILGIPVHDALHTFAPMGAALAAMARFGEGFLGMLGVGQYMEEGFFPLAVRFTWDGEWFEYYLAVFVLEGAAALLACALSMGHGKEPDRFRRTVFYLCLPQILLESLRYDHFLEFSFVRLEQVAYGLILVFGVARAIRSRKRGPAWPAIALTAAAIGVSAGVEFALDRTSISHPLLYAVMIAALALPVGMALRGITGKGTERA